MLGFQPAPAGRTHTVPPYAALSAADPTRWQKTLRGKDARRRAPGKLFFNDALTH